MPKTTHPRPQAGSFSIISLPRELRGHRAVAGAVANIDEALQAPKALSPSAAPLNVRCAVSTRSRKSLSQMSIPTIRQRPAKALAKAGSFAINPFPR